MKYYLTFICIFFKFIVTGNDPGDYTIVKSFWNIETQTLDVVLFGDQILVDNLYTYYDDIDFSIQENINSSFELLGVHKGLSGISEKKASVPKKILIAVDQGENNTGKNQFSAYQQLAAEIIAKHPTGFVYELVVLSENLSGVKRISKYTLAQDLNQLKETIIKDQPTNFYRLFKSIDIQDYKKIFLLSNGNSQLLSNNTRSLFHIIDQQNIGVTQVIPVSNENEVNEEFFEHLEKINLINIRRSNFNEIPPGEMPKVDHPFDHEILLLKYQQNLDGPLQNNRYTVDITTNSSDPDKITTKRVASTLAPFSRPVINTKINSKTAAIKNCLFLGLVLGGLLYYMIPLINRIIFKRNHVFAYSKIHQEGTTHNDPLKMSKIKPEDQVVQYEDHVMLLESWKYIKKNMSNPKYAKEYKHFFKNSVDGNIFNQNKQPFQYILPLLLGCIVATIFSLVYVIYTHNIFLNWQSLEINSIISKQISNHIPLLDNALILSSILLGSVLILEVLRWNHYKQIDLQKTFLNLGLASFMVGFILLCVHYTLSTIQFQAEWIIIAGISISITSLIYLFHTQEKESIPRNLILIFLGSFVSFIILPKYLLTDYLTESIIFQISNLIFYTLVGCIYVTSHQLEQKPLGIKIISPPDIDTDIYYLEQHFQNEIRSDFIIGKDPQSDLYVKWLDIDVESKHAIITKSNNSFAIEPGEGLVFVNQKRIESKTIISDNDEIQLGEDSISQFTIVNT